MGLEAVLGELVEVSLPLADFERYLYQIKPFDFGPLLQGLVFPTFPTRETSVQFLGKAKKGLKILSFTIL